MRTAAQWLAWVKALLLALPLAATARDTETLSVLDRSTGNTLQVTASPWILALEQPLLAANARDYVALYAVETSNGGRRRHYIAAFFWSTVPGRNRHAGSRPGLRLLFDGRDMTLEAAPESLRDAGIGRWPLKAPGRDALLMLYPADANLLRNVGHTDQLRLRPLPDADLPPELWFETWRAGTMAFRQFADSVIGPP